MKQLNATALSRCQMLLCSESLSCGLLKSSQAEGGRRWNRCTNSHNEHQLAEALRERFPTARVIRPSDTCAIVSAVRRWRLRNLHQRSCCGVWHSESVHSSVCLSAVQRFGVCRWQNRRTQKCQLFVCFHVRTHLLERCCLPKGHRLQKPASLLTSLTFTSFSFILRSFSARRGASTAASVRCISSISPPIFFCLKIEEGEWLVSPPWRRINSG